MSLSSRAPALLALLALMIGFMAVATTPSDASNDYEQAVDLTFPVGGTSYSYIDDYHFCRGSGCERRHRATDVMAPYGAPVHAAVGGTISFITGLSSPVPSYGYMITIAGDDGRSYSYIHLGRQDRGPDEAYAAGMRAGVRVDRGQLIGYNGCSGNASCNAPHLHFEIEDRRITDPHGSNRMNPFTSLRSAESRGDFPGRFRDVTINNTHHADIERIAAAAITRGCNPPTNDRYCPKSTVTREQMAAFLVRSLNLTKTSGRTFQDVPAGSTFAADIDRLATAGITRGCNPPANDRFCPKGTVTREQMAAFLGRALGLSESSGGSFRDVSAGSTFAADIDRLATAGITRGCNPPANDRFCPKGTVTREQMASFLSRSVF
jgi:hypothetical protein